VVAATDEYLDGVMHAGVTADMDTPVVALSELDQARRLIREWRLVEILTGLLDVDL
jgi:hypothetical protein